MAETNQFSDAMRAIRWRWAKEDLRFADEIRLIPRWLLTLVIVLLLAAEVIAQIVVAGRPPWSDLSSRANDWGVAGVVMGVGLVVGALILLMGYINRDAKRRGMHYVMWTLLAIFLPNLIGVILYFLLREPLPFRCPECRATVTARYNFCPSCKHNLRPACPQCKREVSVEDRYCPHCAWELAADRSR